MLVYSLPVTQGRRSGVPLTVGIEAPFVALKRHTDSETLGKRAGPTPSLIPGMNSNISASVFPLNQQWNNVLMRHSQTGKKEI